MLSCKHETNCVDLTNEILQELLYMGRQFNSDVVKYLIDMQLLNPKNCFTDNYNNYKAEIKQMIDVCIHFLYNSSDICICLLKMQQLFYGKDRITSDNVSHHCRSLILNMVKPLLNIISDAKPSTDEKSNKKRVDQIYKKLVYVIILLTGLGNPKNLQDFDETQVALNSVCRKDKFEKFLANDSKTKLFKIDEYTKIVTGIRIYNKRCFQTKSNVEELISLLKNGYPALRVMLDEIMAPLIVKIYSLTDILTKFYHFDAECKNIFVIETLLTKNDSISNQENMEICRNLLILYQQLFVCLRSIMNNTITAAKEVDQLSELLNKFFYDLNHLINYKSAIPTKDVYPKFMDVSEIWNRFQDLMFLFKYWTDLIEELPSYSTPTDVPSTLTDYIDNFQKTLIANMEDTWLDILKKQWTRESVNNASFSIYSISNRTSSESIGNFKKKELINPEKVSGEIIFTLKENITLQFNGFCVVYFVEGNGLIFNIDTEIGILKYRDLYFGFYNVDAAHKFGENPDLYILKALDLARENPLFIDLLDMREAAEEMKTRGLLVNKENVVKKIPSRDVTVQTELHPKSIEKGEKSYEWNIWNLKRKALHLANITNMSTHSTQTIKSNYREGAWTQTYDKKDNFVQTMTEKGSNVPKLQNYIWGLRGNFDNLTISNPNIVLTRPVWEGTKRNCQN